MPIDNNTPKKEDKKAGPATHTPRSYWRLSARVAEGKFKIVVSLTVFTLIRGGSQNDQTSVSIALLNSSFHVKLPLSGIMNNRLPSFCC